MTAAPDTAAVDLAFAGRSPRLAVEPATLAEAAEAMRAFARDRLAVGFVGGGTELELGAPPARLDGVLRTARLSRVVEHAPADQMVHVEAGIPLAELQRQLAPHGQRLALDPPLPERATVGGLLAANGFGPRRLRFGGMRDLVIGVTLIRADGEVARGGGKVVKNVAGFDLPRLLCGSLGSLALIAEVILRLHPLPEASATIRLGPVGAGEARALAGRAQAAGLEPVALVALPAGAGFTLAIRFEGFGPGVEDQAGRLVALAQAAGYRPERLEGADEAALWAGHDALRTTGDVRVKATFVPATIQAAADALATLAGSLRGGAVLLYPTLGIAFASGACVDAGATARALASARDAVRAGNGAVVLAAAPAALRAHADPWGPPPPALAVMRSLKQELDPDHRLVPGRLPGGI